MYIKSKKTAAGILALLMTTSALASCSDSGTEPIETTAQQSVETTTAETTTSKLTPDIPDLDFGGEDMHFLTSGNADTNGYHWESYDVYAAEETGDVISDAVYKRNMYVQEAYNVEIKETKSTGTTLSEAQKVILAGEDVYDAVTTNLGSCTTLAQAHQTYDMHELPYIDLEQPWWDGNLAKNLSVNHKMNYATGDILLIDNDSVWVLMFNKQMYKNYGFDPIYELVESDKWLLDKFIETAHAASSDLNGDGSISPNDDQYGFVSSGWSGIGIVYSSGLSLTKKNDKDLPEFNLDIDTTVSIGEKMGSLMASNTTLLSVSNTEITPDFIREKFQDGKVLFYGEVLQCMQRMRASDTAFGLVPWPKYTETQEDFGAICIATACKAVTVPITAGNTEKVGAVLEAMAAESMYTMTPAYYEMALSEKYMRDSESVKMLDMILENVSIDLGFTYAWGGIVANIYNSIKDNDGKLVSKIESTRSAFDTAMQNTIDAYLSK